MSLLANLATDDSIENETDVTGGGNYGPIESGLYEAKVDLAYLSKSKGGALALNLNLSIDGREVRQQLWITSGDAKGNRNFYVAQDGTKKYLPGFNVANSLCLLTLGKELSQVEPEEKVINVYDYEAKKALPTKMPVLTDLIGQDVIAAILKQIVDKNVQDGNGKYVPSGETREVNEVDKFFRSKDRLTTAEIRAKAEEPAFYNLWDERNTGKTRDRSTKDASSTGTQSSSAFSSAANSNTKPKESIFGT